jgi:hypothetical protein
MCRQCQSQFGYFCSAECRGAARAVVTEAERAEAAAEKAEFAHRAKIARTIVSVGVGLFLLLVAFVVWRLFLNPAGKVCWQWDCAPDKPKSAQILTADAGRVLVRLGRKVVSLDPKTGKVVQTLDLESAPATGTATAPETAADGEGGDEDEEEDSGGYSAFLNQVRPVPNGFVETSSDTIARYDAAGKQSARKSYPMGRISHLALSQDGTKAWYAAEQPADLAAA